MLVISNISKSFGKKQVLKEASFVCKPNELVGLFGRNGTGKSTLFQLVFGLLKADAIQLEVNGKQLKPIQIIPSKTIGYVPQHPFLPQSVLVRDVIPFVFGEQQFQDKVFNAPGIAALTRKRVGHLSAGQRRYLEILLIGNLHHSYLFLDEPFAMIDPLYADLIQAFLLSLKKHKGIVITDHYYRSVLEVTDRNYVLKDQQLYEMNHYTDLVKYGYVHQL